ncbi:MAG: tetratricopeptide repeat protein [Desulfobacteraceae bacterium]|nr:MAG: tetratricopeptide repeat protein [Desulfobacteraceae bacterium]
MATEKKVGSRFVKRETLFIVALIAMVVGFLGGVTFSSFKLGSEMPVRRAAPIQQTAQDQAPTAEQSSMIAALENEVSLNPENVEAWVQLGNNYFDTNKFVKAIKAYRQSLELNPNNADVWTDLGVMYRRNGQPAEAIKAFNEAMKIDPFHEISRLNKGIVFLHDLNDREGAIRAWEELVRINPFARIANGEAVMELLEKLKEGMNR